MVEGEGGAGPIRLRNNKRRSLGPEWSMSEVGTPPSHNWDKPHVLVASNTHTPIVPYHSNFFMMVPVTCQ